MTNKILLVDDIQDNLDLLEDLLDDELNYNDDTNKVEFLQASCGQEALDIVNKTQSIDLILLDIMMPDIDGFEVCKRLKENSLTQDIPIIFITAKNDSEDLIKGFELGASDYISKPFCEQELLARIKKELKIQNLIKNLNFMASHDQMTGIYNRRKFFELADNLFQNHTDSLYAVMIDIDKFKSINDTYGHNTGDDVIKQTAKTINDMLNINSIFGRIGGEEFAIICDIFSLETVQQNIENIRKAIEELEVIDSNNKTIKFTISAGIAKQMPFMKDTDELLKYADIALYEAKRTGRNKVIFKGDN